MGTSHLRADSANSDLNNATCYAPRGPLLGPLLTRPEKNDLSFSLLTMVVSCAFVSVDSGSLARVASRSYS